MKKKMVVSTGDGYGDSKYIFNNEKDAVQFFQLIGKANPVTADYVTGKGYVYYEVEVIRTTMSASYQVIHSQAELKVIKNKEDADRLFAEAGKAASEAEKVASEEAA